MSKLIEQDPFHQVISYLLLGVPFLDVRAEIEFARGSLPHAINIPILNTEERAQVGTCYKVQGKEQAIQLGHQLVQGKTKSARVQQWKDFLSTQQHPILYCFRGGMRSQFAQNWLKEVGCEVERIEGGYKKLRGRLMENLAVPFATQKFLVLSGKTGCGKTDILIQAGKVTPVINLEDLANHRGSSFGALARPQPSQMNFENTLALELERFREDMKIVIEDESTLIGKCVLPSLFLDAKNKAPVIQIETTMEDRIQRIYKDYVKTHLTENDVESETPKNFFLTGLDRIQKKLGGLRHQIIKNQILEAFSGSDPEKHHQWIKSLLSEYYDPLYEKHELTKKDRIVFQGNPEEVLNYLTRVV